MPEAFDTGPLSWVKDEIDQSLGKVLNSFNAVSQDLDTVASLRLTLAHLYQVNGALDMVGLEGCKRYCAEIEKLTSKIVQQIVPATPLIIAQVVKAIETLSQYLQDLMNGAADIPVRLYPTLKPLVDAQGESIEESELFFPNTDQSAPKDLPSNPIEETAIPIFVAEQRSVFQRALLEWLRTKNTDALSAMRDAVKKVQEVQVKNAARTLWWTAAAFAESLAQDKIASDSGAKKLCRKLDRQLGQLATGDAKAPSQLLRELLYYIAVSNPQTALISQVKDVFELDDAMPREAAFTANAAQPAALEQAALAQLLADMPSLKEWWSAASGDDAASAAALTDFIHTLEAISTGIHQDFTSMHMLQLINAVIETAHTLKHDQHKVHEVTLIEIASALNLLEQGCHEHRRQDAELKQKIVTQSERLRAVAAGAALAPALEAFAGDSLDAGTLHAVARQILDALAEVEKALDSFFRNPEESAMLEYAEKPLQQIAAAFEMLDMPVPKAVADSSVLFVDCFKRGVDNYCTYFELLAESLSMLGLYTEAIPHVRPEAETALTEALHRMQQGMELLRAGTSKLPENQPAQKSSKQFVAAVGQEAIPVFIAPPSKRTSVNAGATATELVPSLQKDTTISAHHVIDRALDAELQDIYLTEAEEVLAALAQNLQALRVNATDSAALNEVRRAYHTLKGSGRTVGLTALGDVAWAVEALLNHVIELKAFPTSSILAFIENVTASFAGWVAELQDEQSVSLDPAEFSQQAKQLSAGFEQGLVKKAAPQKEEVLIGGTRKISKIFFDIFLAEAEQHYKTLVEARDFIAVDPNESYRAAHTLGSNALTAGFMQIGALARALEHWLDEHDGQWNPQQTQLYGNVINALGEGLESVKALNEPKTTRAWISALAESTSLMQAQATQTAEAALLKAEPAEKLTKKRKRKDSFKVLTEELSAMPAALDVPATLADGEAMIAAHGEAAVADSKHHATRYAHANSVGLRSDAAGLQVQQSTNTLINQELLTLFLEEAHELVPQIGKDLRAWRANPQEQEYVVDSLQRLLHTLKGSARMAGLSAIGNSVHGMEDHVIRALSRTVGQDDFDSLFMEFDQISLMLEQASVGFGMSDTEHPPLAQPALAVPARKAERKTQFLRMHADVLDRLINEAGEVSIMRSRMDREMQSFKQSSVDLTDSIARLRTYLRELEIEAETQLQSRMSLLQEANEAFDPLEFDRFTRLQELTRMMAESVNDVSTIQHSLLLNLDQTDAALQQQNRMNRELQQGLMRVRMLPFATITERLQRIVRQTARELNKRVEMTIEGETTELDRGVLDKLGAPLEHLLRNAVAHGLENAEGRNQAGKTETGHIRLNVSMENDEITLAITDDGAGINLAKVRQKATEKGFLIPEQSVTEQTLMALIFEPGFSTADSISQIAGRGVGLDAVRSDIAALGGRIDVSNIVGSGAMFNIYLPVTLSVAQVVLVSAGAKIFAIPTVMIEQVQKLRQKELENAYSAGKIEWSGRAYPLHFLSRLIGDSNHVPHAHIYTPVIMLRSGTTRTALHVDEIIGSQEVVMKSMGTQLAHVPGIIGASVLGDGTIVLVINAVQLANRETFAAGVINVGTKSPVSEQTRKVALVVDDSLTMRKVLSRVLEREEIEVITANDGMDAIEKLQVMTPDIILTDIEMPRMDGFEFSRYVRDNPVTMKIPLIVISSRTADKHRNVAAEIGVNAFLGKPVQDETLLEQVSALLKK